MITIDLGFVGGGQTFEEEEKRFYCPILSDLMLEANMLWVDEHKYLMKNWLCRCQKEILWHTESTIIAKYLVLGSENDNLIYFPITVATFCFN
jgi:hypothetical protein